MLPCTDSRAPAHMFCTFPCSKTYEQQHLKIRDPADAAEYAAGFWGPIRGYLEYRLTGLIQDLSVQVKGRLDSAKPGPKAVKNIGCFLESDEIKNRMKYVKLTHSIRLLRVYGCFVNWGIA